MQKLLAIVLLFSFSSVFTYETAEFFLFGKKEHSPVFTGIQEFEEDTEGNEQSREEGKDELKFADDFYIENSLISSLFASNSSIVNLNHHYQSSDYSVTVYCPPELI